MSDSNLSQEDIDKLLTDVDDINLEDAPVGSGSAQDRDDSIRESEISKFNQFFAHILDASTTLFQASYNKNLTYSQIRSSIKDQARIKSEFQAKTFIQVTINYTSGIKGEVVYLISITEGLKLAEYLTGQKFKEINETSITSISNIITLLNKGLLEFLRNMGGENEFLCGSPRTEVIDSSSKINFSGSSSQGVVVSFKLNPEVHPPLDLQVYSIISVPMAKELIKIQQDSGSIEWKASDDSDDKKTGISIRPVKYSPLDIVPVVDQPGDIGLLIDINMQLTVELGQTRCRVKEILGWGEGSIVELTKHAGEPVDILVNGKLIAKGEVVVIDENFGVRVTEVISGQNRLEALK